MLSLPDVTLVSVHTVCHHLSRMAIHECTSRVRFGDVKIFSNLGADRVHIDPFVNLIDAGQFTVNELPKYIKTSHALFIHYDSWVLDTSVWDDEYLKYDYIGAPWWHNDEHNVGNSGFCLRSTKLMQFLAENNDKYPIVPPEDHTLCRMYQSQLPQFKWAPQAVAQKFAFERVRPAIDSKHFGYHGMFNWPFVLSYEEFNTRLEFARQDPYLKTTNMLAELDAMWYGVWGHLIVKPAKIYKG